MDNLPDDWNCYWITCSCGRKYHASQWCVCEDLSEEELEELDNQNEKTEFYREQAYEEKRKLND